MRWRHQPSWRLAVASGAPGLDDLLAIVGSLRRRGIGFRSLHEALDTTTPGGRLVFHVFAALAEFIRELIVEGTRDGLAAARARGQRLGRPPALTPEQVEQARYLLTRRENTIASTARLLRVSRATIYAHVPRSWRRAGPRSSPRRPGQYHGGSCRALTFQAGVKSERQDVAGFGELR